MKKLEIEMRNLIGLQGCDNRTKDIQRKREEGPNKIQKLKDGLNALERQLEEESTRLEEYNLERRRIEQSIDDIENQTGKSKLKLGNIKSNKEYQAALKEISDLDREKSLLEDNAIGIMEEIEALEDACVVGEAKKVAFIKEFERDRDEILRQMKAMDQEFESLEKERSRLSRTVDKELLRRYDFLREHKGGLAISSVIKGVCQACHLGIPPQKFNELIRGDELMTCPHCKRIMYWGENERYQVVEKD